MSDHDTIETEKRLRGPAVTEGVYADLAWAIVEAHNAEGRDLNHQSFLQSTSRLTVAQRYAVLREMPHWAQKRLNNTAGIEDAA